MKKRRWSREETVDDHRRIVFLQGAGRRASAGSVRVARSRTERIDHGDDVGFGEKARTPHTQYNAARSIDQ